MASTEPPCPGLRPIFTITIDHNGLNMMMSCRRPPNANLAFLKAVSWDRSISFCSSLQLLTSSPPTVYRSINLRMTPSYTSVSFRSLHRRRSISWTIVAALYSNGFRTTALLLIRRSLKSYFAALGSTLIPYTRFSRFRLPVVESIRPIPSWMHRRRHRTGCMGPDPTNF